MAVNGSVTRIGTIVSHGEVRAVAWAVRWSGSASPLERNRCTKGAVAEAAAKESEALSEKGRGNERLSVMAGAEPVTRAWAPLSARSSTLMSSTKTLLHGRHSQSITSAKSTRLEQRLLILTRLMHDTCDGPSQRSLAVEVRLTTPAAT